ncbi:hypothetical protein [Pleomorphovibrio marinus]|uniref:hypothetical protein n=1 Tax=Pleomorphovibrio marinus TaxID=2164132 RepID=UPI0013004F3E|nr:hypothetical protein [Pleomorphovibrio marinus]
MPLIDGQQSLNPEKDNFEHKEHNMVRIPNDLPDYEKFMVLLKIKMDGKIVDGAFDLAVKK